MPRWLRLPATANFQKDLPLASLTRDHWAALVCPLLAFYQRSDPRKIHQLWSGGLSFNPSHTLPAFSSATWSLASFSRFSVAHLKYALCLPRGIGPRKVACRIRIAGTTSQVCLFLYWNRLDLGEGQGCLEDPSPTFHECKLQSYHYSLCSLRLRYGLPPPSHQRE